MHTQQTEEVKQVEEDEAIIKNVKIFKFYFHISYINIYTQPTVTRSHTPNKS